VLSAYIIISIARPAYERRSTFLSSYSHRLRQRRDAHVRFRMGIFPPLYLPLSWFFYSLSIPRALIFERHFSNIILSLPLFRRNILAFGGTTAATWTTFLKRFLISTSLRMYKEKEFISANKVRRIRSIFFLASGYFFVNFALSDDYYQPRFETRVLSSRRIIKNKKERTLRTLLRLLCSITKITEL